MKRNNEVSAIEQFQKSMQIGLSYYYHKARSESIKRGLAKKKLSTTKKLLCKAE